jgi:hypothetical protein
VSEGMTEKQAAIAVANEYNRLKRQIEAKTQQLEALLAVNGPGGEFPTDFASAVPRRYTVALDFEAGVLDPKEKSALIDVGTVFRVAYIETFVRAVGTTTDRFSGLPVSIQATLGWEQRLFYFDFLWKVRDTGTDREWVTPAQPSQFAGGGYTGPLWLPRRNILSGGTALHVGIQPTVSVADPEAAFKSFFTGGLTSKFEVQFCFVGHEVQDRSAL